MKILKEFEIDLYKWMMNTGIFSIVEIARICDVDVSYMRKLHKGEKIASLETGAKIEKALNNYKRRV